MQRMARYAGTDSWAIWPTDPDGELTGERNFPSTGHGSIHGGAIIVSLNPGGDPDGPALGEWGNFHAERAVHNDIFLAHAFHGTKYWGAYMTDLHPDVRESDSALVRPNSELVDEAAELLAEKILLIADVEKIVCVGGYTFRQLTKRVDLLARKTGLGADALVKIDHYSRANAGRHKHKPALYRQLVHADLGLTPAS